MLSQVLSLPDEWKFSVGGLCSINKESEKAISSALKELKENGYLNIEKIRKDNKFDYIYNFYEMPKSLDPHFVGLQVVGLQNEGLQNGTLYINTNVSNTNVSNTNIYTLLGKEIISYLNEKANKNFKPVDSNLKYINARLKEGFTKEDFFTVIDKKCSQWKGKEYDKYLRPETLFSPSKFQSYLNENINYKKEVAWFD